MLINYLRIEPLAEKKIEASDNWFYRENKGYLEAKLRIMFFDPRPVYERLHSVYERNQFKPSLRLNHYNRIQSFLPVEFLFPVRPDQLCACGCGQPQRRRWATKNCSTFAWGVRDIIYYGSSTARWFIEQYYGPRCIDCGSPGCDVDHVLPVKHGGGGCWLNNFVLRCSECHKKKTRRDFGWGEFKNNASDAKQLKLL